jgi:hypothetical protein
MVSYKEKISIKQAAQILHDQFILQPNWFPASKLIFPSSPQGSAKTRAPIKGAFSVVVYHLPLRDSPGSR